MVMMHAHTSRQQERSQGEDDESGALNCLHGSFRDIKRTTCTRARATRNAARIGRHKPAARSEDHGHKSHVDAPPNAHDPCKRERKRQACELPPVERRLEAAAQHRQAREDGGDDDVPARC